MKYGVLNQKNPAYQPELWSKIDDLYKGGFQLLANAEKYIPQLVGEPIERYRERLALASYINYLGMVVEAYVGNLFAQEPSVVAAPEEEGKKAPDLEPFWREFGADANLKAESFAKVLRDTFTTAILKQRALIGCDFPRMPGEEAPATRAEEDRTGASRAYAFEICLEELLDWDYADIVVREVELFDGSRLRFAVGVLSWAILKRRIQRRTAPEESRDTFFEEFRVWRLVDGVAKWETYRTKARTARDSAPPDHEDLEVAEEGDTSFDQIPIVEIVVPDGLWLGNKLGPIALEMFRRRSALHASMNRHLFPTLVVNLGPEVGAVGAALPPDVQQNPGRGNEALDPVRRMGGVILGHQDKLSYLEPEGDTYELVDKQLSDLVDEFFRVASMMASSVSNTSSALGRSGTSKQQDYRAMAIVLEAYAAVVRYFAVRVYGLIAEARKEAISWKVHGLDKFDVVDRAIVLEEAKSLSLVSIPSPTFNAMWRTKQALALLGNVPPETQEKIEDEIERGIAAEEQLKDVMREGMIDGDEADAGAGARRAVGDDARQAGAPNGAGPAPKRAARPPPTSTSSAAGE